MKAKDLKVLRKKLAKANKAEDILGTVPKGDLTIQVSSSKAKSVDTDVASPTVLKISYSSSETLSSKALDDCLDLFQRNMGHLYEQSSWGLNMDEKIAEMKHKDARFLLVKDDKAENKLAAFVHFRFEYDDEEQPYCLVLYVYEIQVDAAYQGYGIGRKLMTISQNIGRAEELSKILLTVFKANKNAMEFYNKLGYEIDETSPSKFGQPEDYEILSLKL
jgi:ribosomal protein S18 acetylase RimI-like enzyme